MVQPPKWFDEVCVVFLNEFQESERSLYSVNAIDFPVYFMAVDFSNVNCIA